MTKIKDFTLGPTGQFPRGRAGDDDEGELRLAVATDHAHGIVRIAFGGPVTWVGLPADDARQLAQMLIEKADELEQGTH